MKLKNIMLQIVYQSEANNPKEIHWMFREEAISFSENGIMTGTEPLSEATKLLYRGEFLTENNYPKDKRYINNYEQYSFYLFIDKWYPIIQDLTIETFFIDDLNENAKSLILSKGWQKVFIKDRVKSLTFLGSEKSVWPDTSFEQMKSLFIQNSKFNTMYSVRKYIEPFHFEAETRYWIIAGNIYHPSGLIPKIVMEAVARLCKLGGKFFVIDATPDLIIEVNPGETSIRYANNPIEQFVEWIKLEYC